MCCFGNDEEGELMEEDDVGDIHNWGVVGWNSKLNDDKDLLLILLLLLDWLWTKEPL